MVEDSITDNDIPVFPLPNHDIQTVCGNCNESYTLRDEPYTGEIRQDCPHCSAVENSSSTITVPEPIVTAVELEVNFQRFVRMQRAKLVLPHIPLVCALEDCNRSFGCRELMAHCLDHHSTDDNGQALHFIEAYRGVPCGLSFDPTRLEPGVVSMLGFIAYAGKYGDFPPADHGICMRNDIFKRQYKSLSSHLAIAVMAYRGSWFSIRKLASSSNRALRPAFCSQQSQNPRKKLLFIWLAGSDTIYDVKCSIKAHDGNLTTAHGCITTVRSYRDATKSHKFLENNDFLFLTNGQEVQITENHTKNCHLEFIFN